MAEDLENTQKPKVILNKQKKPDVQTEISSNTAVSQETTEKKKVVVVKKKPIAQSNLSGATSEHTDEGQGVSTTKKKNTQTTQEGTGQGSQDTLKRESNVSKAEASGEPRKAPERKVTSIELSPPRPNVKVGNLADRGRPNQGPRSNQDSYPPRHTPNTSWNNNQGKDGFTGAQAREGAKDSASLDSSRSSQSGYRQDRSYQGQRTQNSNYQGQRQGGYQRSPDSGYQGQRPSGPQGQRPSGPPGSRPNYQGQRPSGPPGSRPNYQGQRPGGAPGSRPNYQGQRPGGFGSRPGVAPAPLPTDSRGTTPSKKGAKPKKAVYSRKNKEEDYEQKIILQKKKAQDKANAIPKDIEIMESISVAELARKMNLKASELIAKLMSMGMMVTMNQSIDADTATLLASEYDCTVHIVSLYDETVIESEVDGDTVLLARPPVVTIMGHVDHGKTKTLDAIRSANVAAGEFGGITQHIGAYTVNTNKGLITFLDTPGHEAFTMMRARGAEVTDIVVLVVAADDGVMPQTIEAINHAKDAKVPIIVAVNKIDKYEANPDKVMTQLAERGLSPEEWGGDTMYVKISALQKTGIQDLLDAILLQSEMLELQANYSCRAEGKVIESRIDHGRGIVATIIVERGTLRTGDAYVAGVYSGRVRAIFNDRGEKLEEATPSMPVEILGLEGMPNAGDPFQVTESERTARQISFKRQELKKFESSRNIKKVTLDNLYDTIHQGEVLELKVIIKGDVQGSVEALKQSLEKLSTKDIRLNVIHASAGAINDSDVMLAAADSNALIIGFNVRPTPQAKLLADQEKVDIRKYSIIYKAVEEIELAMEGMLKPDIKEEVIGSVEIREVIKIPKIGSIAGSYVLQGSIKRSSTVHVIREGIVVHSGKLSSLKRFKDDVKEVMAGFECGIGIENYADIRVGDQLEVIELVEIARKLKDSERLEDAKQTKGE